MVKESKPVKNNFKRTKSSRLEISRRKSKIIRELKPKTDVGRDKQKTIDIPPLVGIKELNSYYDNSDINLKEVKPSSQMPKIVDNIESVKAWAPSIIGPVTKTIMTTMISYVLGSFIGKNM